MTREIKFRSWSGKRFYFWGFIKGLFISPIYRDDIIVKEVQQYTGLKDKNGKEIYEGDVVSNEDYIEDAHCYNDLGNDVVEWSNDGAMWGGMIGEIITVIGNIYENPELLN